jgi:hypothetical protein
MRRRPQCIDLPEPALTSDYDTDADDTMEAKRRIPRDQDCVAEGTGFELSVPLI